MKSTIASLTILLVLLAFPLAAGERAEKWLEEVANRMPRPLVEGDTVNDWWPLDKEITYTYKVVGGRWDLNEKDIGTVFTMQISRDVADTTRYYFKVDGFEDFPYSGLIVKKNRVNLFSVLEVRGASGSTPTTRIYEEPFMVFPLFNGLMFEDPKKEKDFLEKTAEYTTDESVYAPAMNGMMYVNAAEETDVYKVTQAIHAPMTYSFKRGVGPVRWSIRGGAALELVSHSLEKDLKDK